MAEMASTIESRSMALLSFYVHAHENTNAGSAGAQLHLPGFAERGMLHHQDLGRTRTQNTGHKRIVGDLPLDRVLPLQDRDRKSTRLNSSHANISYAVFCLKKKKIKICEISVHDTDVQHE